MRQWSSGVNRFESQSTVIADILKVDRQLEDKQIKGLQELRKNRDNSAVQKHLSELEKTASGGDNLVSPIILAVEDYATVGEIADTLRMVWGEHHENA